MRRNCGVCDLRFERQEPGYFVGALYFAYGLAVLLGTPPAAYLWWQGFSIGVQANVQEPGYFVGALYFAYGLAVLLGAPPAAYLWWQGFSLVITGELILFSSWIFQYSRILFLHLDQLFDPT